jgi:hypothetical protein
MVSPAALLDVAVGAVVAGLELELDFDSADDPQPPPITAQPRSTATTDKRRRQSRGEEGGSSVPIAADRGAGTLALTALTAPVAPVERYRIRVAQSLIDPHQMYDGIDQRQMRECLREVAEV